MVLYVFYLCNIMRSIILSEAYNHANIIIVIRVLAVTAWKAREQKMMFFDGSFLIENPGISWMHIFYR